MEKKPEVLEYEKCPVCGEEERLIASLAVKEIEKGVDPNTVPQHLQTWPFVMRGQGPLVIIGSRAVVGNVFIDMCKGCGIIRAIRVEIGEALAVNMPPKG